MTKRDDSDPGKKPPRSTVTSITKVSSGLGRGKSDKPPSSTSRKTFKNLVKSMGGTARKAAPVPNRSVTIKNGKGITKARPKQVNKRDAVSSKTVARKALEAVLAHHDRPITAAEARRMNDIIKADRLAPELRPRRR